ncbi:MAG TPA: RdgB/HAM1 family non-canonical purine NTP pyrophosphatase [Symbiobacteriaceae bacterium]
MSEKRLVLASKNPGKLRELRALLADTGIEVVALDSSAPEVEETGDSFEANALIKARAAVAATGLPALGEDSGLVVDALGGEPGIHSHRWAPGTDMDRVYALLRRMEGIPPGRRTARYVSCIAIVTPWGREEVVKGTLEGEIGLAPRGSGGFGYDPIFVLPDGRTVAELSLEEKNAISHRAKSLAQAKAILPALLEEGRVPS